MQARRLTAFVVLGLCGCASPSTLLRLHVQLAPGEAEPSGGLVVSLYDRFGASLLDSPVAFTKPQNRNLPGTLVLYDAPLDWAPTRAVVDGMVDKAHPCGGSSLALMANATQDVTVVLTSSASLDRDQDGVPDAFDNCPDEPNHDQHSRSGGRGDACESSDGAATPLDASAGDGMVDAATLADMRRAPDLGHLPADGRPPGNGWVDQNVKWMGANDCNGAGPTWVCGGSNGTGTTGYLYFCDQTEEVWTKLCPISCHGVGACPSGHHGCSTACN